MTSQQSRSAALARLGLSADASRDEIVSAFRRLARRTHPDVAESSDTRPDDFSAVADAYRLLADDPAPEDTVGEVASAAPPAQRPTNRPFSSHAWRSAGSAKPPPIVAGPVYVAPLTADRAEENGSHE